MTSIGNSETFIEVEEVNVMMAGRYCFGCPVIGVIVTMEPKVESRN